MNKKLLPAVWVIAIATIILLGGLLKLESTHFFGIADDHEQTISFSYPVEIVQTYAVEGAEVKQGTRILEVRRRDLITKLDIIDDQIQALKTTADVEIASKRAQLEGLKAQQAAELAVIDSQIKNLLSEQHMNKKLVEEISGSKSSANARSPLVTKIRGLREQRGHIEISLAAQITNLENQLNASLLPSDSKLAELMDRKLEFQRQVTDLKVSAKFNGRVGSINYKPGEIVAPYQPILTVHGLSPQYIKGYIHENVFNEVALGQKVWVQSNTNSNNNEPIQAVVESLGSRIVEYPVRLKKNLMVSAWGREAVIRLTEENKLLLGEKVIVSLENPAQGDNFISAVIELFSSTVSPIHASTNNPVPGAPDGYPIQSRIDSMQDIRIEASGIIPAVNTGHYYIVSDESERDKPELLEINSQGELVKRLAVKSGQPVDDLESISRDGDDIFIMASLDGNKKKRRHLLHLRVEEDEAITRGSINVYKLLKTLSTTSNDSATRKFLRKALQEKSINLEAHSVYQNNLYLGFKTPLSELGETVIIKLEDVSMLFKGKLASGSIWKKITLLDPRSGSPSLLSDMLFRNGELMLLSVNSKVSSNTSHLWSYQLASSALNSISSFSGLSAEGISRTHANDELMIVFDGDGKTSSRFLPFSVK